MERTKQRAHRQHSNFLYNRKLAPYVFIAPFILIFSIFFAYPIVSSFVMSFQSVLPGQVEFIGAENYRQLLGDKVFLKAITNSVKYTFCVLLLLVPVPMIFATILNSKKLPFASAFRSTLFIPALTSVVVAGVIFKLLFSEMDTALMNQVSNFLGFGTKKWLVRPGTSMFAMVLLACWRWTGVNIMYYISGLQSIPSEIYESVDVDGANSFQKFWYITVPLLKPTMLYVLTISIYSSMAMFIESYMLYDGNKSIANNGLTIVGYLYRKGIEQNNMGYGAAVGICLLIFVFVVNMIQLAVNGQFKREER